MTKEIRCFFTLPISVHSVRHINVKQMAFLLNETPRTYQNNSQYQFAITRSTYTHTYKYSVDYSTHSLTKHKKPFYWCCTFKAEYLLFVITQDPLFRFIIKFSTFTIHNAQFVRRFFSQMVRKNGKMWTFGDVIFWN